MDFLPTLIDGKRVYAGFLSRLGAGLVDGFAIMLAALAVFSIQHLNFVLSIALAIASAFLLAMYNVYFNAVYGGTLGKLAVGIRVTLPNGGKIGWREAWYRSSVDLIFAAVLLVIELFALCAVDWSAFQSASFSRRIELLENQYLSWSAAVGIGNDVWVWGELIVLLLNERRRAIHDYIAGTVVIHKEYSYEEAKWPGSINPA